jgi:hypothetical protein
MLAIKHTSREGYLRDESAFDCRAFSPKYSVRSPLEVSFKDVAAQSYIVYASVVQTAIQATVHDYHSNICMHNAYCSARVRSE